MGLTINSKLTPEDFVRLCLPGTEQPMIIGREHAGKEIRSTRHIVILGDLGDISFKSLHSNGIIVCEERTGINVDGHLEAEAVHGDELPGQCDDNGVEIVRHRFGITAKTIKIDGMISCGGDIVCEEIKTGLGGITIGGHLVANKIDCKGWASIQKGLVI
jgi:hypothetical protein